MLHVARSCSCAAALALKFDRGLSVLLHHGQAADLCMSATGLGLKSQFYSHVASTQMSPDRVSMDETAVTSGPTAMLLLVRRSGSQRIRGHNHCLSTLGVGATTTEGRAVQPRHT
jgi:hypothetical protein